MSEQNTQPSVANPRAFIDMNGGYQSDRTGVDKEAHAAWVKTTTWDLTRDDLIRLSYFHGDLDAGSDGLGPVNGSKDKTTDTVYISSGGDFLTRSDVSYWLENWTAFRYGYVKATEAHASELRAAAEKADRLREALTYARRVLKPADVDTAFLDAALNSTGAAS